ncbi:MAG: exodeoxyribonuclease VII large subunit [Gammaproteobacteria bacterium]|nr:exodeoxyribonuclease VII large subunit [Gammaproteobacteria bacterium]MDH5801832.1 exodeoxyribonuclease VII large subunit [Gammaproteobacteria bacterium]
MSQSRQILTVSELTRTAKISLEKQFSHVWLEGEISNLANPSSGHWYFSLKDTRAQVRCAMFRTRNRLLRFAPKNGDHVVVLAKVSLYEARGEFQLLVEHMEASGEGALQLQFEQLKQRLSDEGLFAAEHKRLLPQLPTRIGIITSPHGAAVKDVLTVLKRRFAAIPVLIYPTSVQGSNAVAELVRAIRRAQSAQRCDVLILCRGGGSLEDLWCFNTEAVARAIFQCSIPVVTGVGHETDVTIADFVADVRAATPSAAAELVSPDKIEWLETLQALQQRLQREFKNKLLYRKQQLEWLRKRMQHPARRLQTQAQRLDELEQRLLQSFSLLQQQNHTRLQHLSSRLELQSPLKRIPPLQWRLGAYGQRLHAVMAHILDEHRQQLGALGRALDAVSPLATLGRGYAIVRSSNGTIVRNSETVKLGQSVKTQLHRGTLHCTVDAIEPSNALNPIDANATIESADDELQP